MKTTKTYLAEVTTEDANGETARIYDAIRRCTGAPLVPLIYRHLATMPGVLEALWQGVGPLMEHGIVQERVWKIAEGAWPGAVPEPDAALRALSRVELARATDVIDAYNRANPVNYALVCIIRAARVGAGGAQVLAGGPAWISPAPLPAIANIPSMAALDPAARALVDGFGKAGGSGGPVLVPTLYRHIAHWPALLALAAREVGPRLATGAFAEAIGGFHASVAAAAPDIARQHAIGVDPLLHSPAMNAVFDRFSQVIPEMVVVGNFLRRVIDRA